MSVNMCKNSHNTKDILISLGRTLLKRFLGIISHLSFSYLTFASIMGAFPAKAEVNCKNMIYWDNFIIKMESVLQKENQNINYMSTLINSINENKSKIGCDYIFRSSKFFVKNFISGAQEDFDFANEGMIVSILFERDNGFLVKDGTVVRLKKTYEDYLINPSK